jgi:hypothetical protein
VFLTGDVIAVAVVALVLSVQTVAVPKICHRRPTRDVVMGVDPADAVGIHTVE